MKQVSLKEGFGKKFREAREAKGYSRAALSLRLGISPKTIQSWEMGRTFPENLALTPAIEAELGVSFPQMLSCSTEESLVAESDSPYDGKTQAKSDQRVVAGPSPFTFQVVNTVPGVAVGDGTYVSVPLLKGSKADIPVAKLTEKDVEKRCLFPAEWCTSGDALVAFRMRDSVMAPTIPQGALAVVDRRQCEARMLDGRVAAIWLADRGVRIRRLRVADGGEKVFGLTDCPSGRGRVSLDFSRGDMVIGKLLCYMAELE